MICLLHGCRRYLLSTRFTSVRSLSTNLPDSDHVTMATEDLSANRQERVMRICSRYTPSRTTFSLTANDYLALKKRIKLQRFIVLVPAYFISMFGLSFSIPNIFPWVLQETPISIEFLGLEAIDPSFVGISMTVLGTFTMMFIAFSAYPSLALWLMGCKTSFNQRDADFKRRLDFYRCTDSAEVGFSDDYHGDKIYDLTDYRYWVRVQQIKKENSARSKEVISKTQ